MATLPTAKEPKAATVARATSRLATMARGRRQEAPRRVKLPGGAVEALLAVLTCTELDEAHAAAYLYFTDVLHLDPNALVNRQLFEGEAMVQALSRCLREPENVEAYLAVDAQDIRDNLTADERAAVFELYYDYQQQIDPSPGKITPEMASMMEGLVKKKDGPRLRDFGSTVLSSYLLFLDSQPST